MQAAIAFGFGFPMLRVFGSRQTAIEALDILATAAAYVGLIGLGGIFGPPLGYLPPLPRDCSPSSPRPHPAAVCLARICQRRDAARHSSRGSLPCWRASR